MDLNLNKIIPVILSGGEGTRLWPLSRRSYPKQFLNLQFQNQYSLFQATQKRISSLEGIQDRGTFFVEAGNPVYMGMVVGVNNRADDMVVNVVKKKNLTNHRATQTADAVKISQAKKMSLEECIEFLASDESKYITGETIHVNGGMAML